MSRLLSNMEKNVLAAIHAAEQPGFSQAEEYLSRLALKLEQKVQNQVFQYLRKKGLVPEKDSKCPSPPVTLNSFDVGAHKIGTLDSKSLWKVSPSLTFLFELACL